jgi:hypothetical protein
MLLHVSGTVLLAELLDHRFHGFGFSDGNGSEFRLRSSCINPNLRVLEDILVPLRDRTSNGQQVQLAALQDEPNGIGDHFPRLSVRLLSA